MSNAQTGIDPKILDGGPPFNTETLADFLGISPRTAERWRWSGNGPPYVLVGGQVRYLRTDVACWLRSQRRRSTSDRAEGGANGRS
jgi:hypothetical protein